MDVYAVACIQRAGQRRGVGRRQRAEAQAVEADLALAALPAGQGELQQLTTAQRLVFGRPPGHRHMPLAQLHGLPVSGWFEHRRAHPPHVVAAGIHQLELQVVGRAFATQAVFECVVRRVRQRDALLQADVARDAMEVVVQAQRLAGIALDQPQAARDLVGRHHLPALGGFEVIQGACVLPLRHRCQSQHRHQQQRLGSHFRHLHSRSFAHRGARMDAQPLTLPTSRPCM